MRRSAAEKQEIIHLVEHSALPVKRALAELDVPRSSFYRWYQQHQQDGPEGPAAPAHGGSMIRRLGKCPNSQVLSVSQRFRTLTDKQEKATLTVLEQAEAIAKDWAG